MKRRYDLRRSDNYMYSGKISYLCSGSGTLKVYTGFPVTRATVSWSVYPFEQDEDMSSSSSSFSSNSSSIDSSSSSSSSSLDAIDSGSSESLSSESLSSFSELPTGLPRLYVSSYDLDGFNITYENIPTEVGYIEFGYTAV